MNKALKRVLVKVPINYPNPQYWVLKIDYDGLPVRSYGGQAVCFAQDRSRQRANNANDFERLLASHLKKLKSEKNFFLIQQITFDHTGITIKKYDTHSWNQAGPILVKSLKSFFGEHSVELVFPEEVEKSWGM